MTQLHNRLYQPLALTLQESHIWVSWVDFLQFLAKKIVGTMTASGNVRVGSIGMALVLATVKSRALARTEFAIISLSIIRKATGERSMTTPLSIIMALVTSLI